MDARLTICSRKSIVTKSKEAKEASEEGLGSKGAVVPMMMMMMMMIITKSASVGF